MMAAAATTAISAINPARDGTDSEGALHTLTLAATAIQASTATSVHAMIGNQGYAIVR
jgi:hypothetical protein